jgi:hypothetical protein
MRLGPTHKAILKEILLSPTLTIKTLHTRIACPNTGSMITGKRHSPVERDILHKWFQTGYLEYVNQDVTQIAIGDIQAEQVERTYRITQLFLEDLLGHLDGRFFVVDNRGTK